MTWAPVHVVPVAIEPHAPAVAGVDDDDAASDATALSGSAASTTFGDSLVSGDEEESERGLRPSAAVAADGEDAPREREHRRAGRPPKDTSPKERITGAFDSWAAQRNDADHVGNIGWLFGNWGNRPRDREMRAHIEKALKRNPAMIMGLAECDKHSEELLRTPGEKGDPRATEHSLEYRDAYEYLTLRGSESSSVLLAIRKQMGTALELLSWERRHEGRYRRRKSGGRAHAYSRCLIVKVLMDQNVGFLGKSHTVMVLHVHNHLANNKWPAKLKKFWTWLFEKVRDYRVQVLMGDFNMALFRVIPELRSRGLTVDLGAWYPWKTPAGTPMSDSCGIFS